MIRFASYPSDRAAIREATKLAKEVAHAKDCEWFEVVLLRSGYSLIITSTPGGKVSHRKQAGWICEGLLHCGPTATRVGVMP